MLALAAAVIPSETGNEISKLYKVPFNPDGFFQEAHVKLRPVDFAADAVFMCGANHYPKHIAEAVSQAHGAAGRERVRAKFDRNAVWRAQADRYRALLGRQKLVPPVVEPRFDPPRERAAVRAA